MECVRDYSGIDLMVVYESIIKQHFNDMIIRITYSKSCE